jgi:hypothetical protein
MRRISEKGEENSRRREFFFTPSPQYSGERAGVRG